MSGTDLLTGRFERGERLACRGALWRLADLERGAGCLALHLAEEAGHGTRTLLAPFDRFRPAPAPPAPEVARPSRWLRHAATLHARCHSAGGLRAAASAAFDLHPYQIEPALAVLRHGATRLLIADAVGLGKTIQAGVILSELARQSTAFRALILVPAGLRDQWAQELKRCFALDTLAADAAWLRDAVLERPAGSNPWALPGIYLASHDFVKRPEVLHPIEDLAWDLLVVDEAHNASSGTNRRAAADAIAVRSSRVVLLTATPHAGDPIEFTALCSIGRVEEAGSPIVLFGRSHAEAGAAVARRSTLLSVRPTPAEARMHELLDQYTRAVLRESRARGDALARLAAIVLRKRALSSARSLAESVRRRIGLLAGRNEPAAEQLRLPLGEDRVDDEVPADVLGAPGLAHAARERRWLAAIAEAAERAGGSESKTRVLRRLLARVREPAIVFTEYRDTLVRLSRTLAASGRTILLLHGGMTASERSQVQIRFNRDDAILLATDAAAEGLNLHSRCRLIVHYELPWSLSRLEQRAGRVDRLGQPRRVHEVGLVASATAERLVLEPLVRRAHAVRASGTERRGFAAALTESRMADIIAGDAEPLSLTAAVPREAADTFRRLDLRDEADAEVRRLAAARRALGALRGAAGRAARSSSGSPSRDAWIAGRHDGVRREERPLLASIRCRRSRLEPGFILVYVITLLSREGRRVHVEAAAIGLPENGPPPGRLSAGALRSAFDRCLRAAGRELAHALSATARRALDVAAPIHHREVDAIGVRHAAGLRRRTSAARQLVQQGLFDRPGARRSSDPATSLPPLHHPPGGHPSVLGVDVRLSAALLVRRR